MKFKFWQETWRNWGVRQEYARSETELRVTTWQEHAFERVFAFHLTIRIPTIYAITMPTTGAYIHLAWVLSAYFSDNRVRSIIATLSGSVDRDDDGNWFHDDIPF